MATILTNAGRAINAARMLGATPAQLEPKNVAIGSGTGTSAITDTTLFTEYTTAAWTGYARGAAAGTQTTTSVTNDTAQWQDTFTAGAAQTVTNAGNFDATTVGNLHIKGDFTGVVLANGDSIQITIKDQKN